MHELEIFTDGSTAFAAARVSAWHKLGTVLPGVFTAEQAMTVARLGGWDVDKAPVFARITNPEGSSDVVVPGKYATTRTNPVTGLRELIGGTHAGIVGPVYDPFQNEQLCEFLNALVDQSGATFDTAGSLRGGADVFVTMTLPKDPHRHPLFASQVRAGASPIDLVDLEQYFCDEHTADALWTTQLRPQLLVVREAALADPRRLLSDAGLVAGLIARRALAMGGYEFPPGLYSGEYLVELLLEHLDEPGIRAAFADLIALEHPDLVGDQGLELGRTYAAMREQDICLRDGGTLQFFVFDRLHTAPLAASTYVDLDGRYLATKAVYRSALDEPDAGWPAMVIGWREIALTPADDSWDTIT
jgi:hypothetical protein